jgi:hypothetical protein
MSRFLLVCVALAAAGPAQAGEPWSGSPRRPQHSLGRMRPVGGWSPDGRGLVHWWDPHCFPRPCGPDDYDRKPLPYVCLRPRACPRP